MTVSSTTNRWEYLGDGSTTAFGYTNKVFDASDLEVYLAGVLQTLGTHYTVSGAGSPNGGNVTVVSAPGAGVEVTILRRVADIQQTDYREFDSFPAEVHENALDRRTIVSQQQQEAIDRSLKFPLAEQNTPSPELPDKATRAGTTLGFDNEGRLIPVAAVSGEVIVSALGQTLIDDPDEAAMQATLGASAWFSTLWSLSTAAAHRGAIGVPTLRPQDYGAVGDGATEDTTALVNWLTALEDHAALGVVPPGTYLFNGRLLVKHRTTIWAYGATFKVKDAGSSASGVYLTDSTLLAGADDVAIYGLTVDGNRANLTPPGSGALIYGISNQRLTLIGCRTANGTSDGLYIGGMEVNEFVRAETAQAATASTITLDANASATDDTYNGKAIYIYDGAGAGLRRIISDYVGSTKVATIQGAWAQNATPDSTSKYIIGTARDGLARDVYVQQHRASNNYRNNISIVGVNGCVLDRPFATAANGTAPQAGIDIEPNDPGSANYNLVIRNATANENAGIGIMEQPYNYGVLIDGARVDRNLQGGVKISNPLRQVQARGIRGSGNTGGLLVGGLAIDLTRPQVGATETARPGLLTVIAALSEKKAVSLSSSTLSTWLDVSGSTITIPAHYSSGIIRGSVTLRAQSTAGSQINFRLYDNAASAEVVGAAQTIETFSNFRTITIRFRSPLSGTATTWKVQANIGNSTTLNISDDMIFDAEVIEAS